MTEQRGLWGSRLGFILAAAGSAVGLGAIWKFPYMAGQNGGGAFLLVYLGAVLGMGLAMMLAELALGRATHLDAVGAFQRLGGKKWTFFGYFSLLAAFFILSFYCVVGGWTVAYLVKAVSGSLLHPPDGAGFTGQFAAFIGDRTRSLIYFVIFLGLTTAIILGGVRAGIERVSKVLMPLLFLLMLVMIVRSVSLPGAAEGLRFFFIPDLSKITTGVLLEALGFACFSLSLGFGGMLTYGSYMRREENMLRAALWVIVLQTACAVLAGLMVLPAVFAFGFEAASGPGLSYITLPAVFKAMPGGAFFAPLFFALLLIAALTSSVSILEPLVAFLLDQYGMRRAPAACLTAVCAFLAGIPACWSFGAGSVGEWFGKTPFDILDALTSNVMLPINVMGVCLLMGWTAAPAFRRELYGRFLEQAGLPVARPLWATYVEWNCKIAAPALIALILAAGLL